MHFPGLRSMKYAFSRAARLKARRGVSLRLASFLLTLIITICVHHIGAWAQQTDQWMPQQTIPNYHLETAEPPYLIADQNRTVHAFSHQQVGEGEKEIAIIYNQWTLENGWTRPVDILLSPIKHQARLLGATLDEVGIFHLLFFGGDETESNVYYSRAPAVSANNAQAWSKPILVGKDALTPESGGIAGDGKGKLVMVYSGYLEGRAWYTITSTDGGDTWTEPLPFFRTRDDALTPYYLRLYFGQSGLLHAVWTVNDILNRGDAVYYGSFDTELMQWRDPVQLAETKGGLGTLAPSMIEYQATLFVMYYEGTTGKQYFRRSDDAGKTWTEPITPFLQVGLNGPGFFTVDSNDILHFFWAQRITGKPDIHGMWHTTWQNGQWSAYEAIVSGPRISDNLGNSAFDPIVPIVAVRQGNILLVVWRSDYGLKANGIWYSYKQLNAPELPVVALPTQPATPEVTPAMPVVRTVPEIIPTATLTVQSNRQIKPETTRSPAEALVISLTPPVLLISAMIIIRKRHRTRR